MRLIDADAVEQKLVEKYVHLKDCSDAIDVVREMVQAMPTIGTDENWTPCAERLPENEKNVLLSCRTDRGRDYTCRGHYVEKYTKEIGCADDLEADYDDETDRNYCPEGFYENIENWGDYSFVYINDTVLAWQPLPEPYNPDHIVNVNKEIVEPWTGEKKGEDE
ncbi:MAG: DUF551 domain-containing protein [Christensenella sp.]|nr:DUF551 domain-containing protein [Christensenella sp.]